LGAINFDAQEIIFDLQWNPGVDYDVNGTGLANPNVGQDPQAIYTYKAATVTSTFSRGKFEQELTGVLVQLPLPEDKKAVNGSTYDDGPLRAVRAAEGNRLVAGDRPAAGSTAQQVRDAEVLKINEDATAAYNASNEFSDIDPLENSVQLPSIRPFTPGEPDSTSAFNADDPEAQVFVPSFAPPPKLRPSAASDVNSAVNADDPEAQIFNNQLMSKDD